MAARGEESRLLTPASAAQSLRNITALSRIAIRARKRSVSEAELRFIESASRAMRSGSFRVPTPRHHTVAGVFAAYRADRATAEQIVVLHSRSEWAHEERIRLYGVDEWHEVRSLTREVLARMAKELSMSTAALTAANDGAGAPNGIVPPDTFGARLVDLRLRAGLTQVELAVKCHTSPSAIRKWEHNEAKPQAARINLLCSVLHCKRSDLIPNR